jgi:hypothetical protein
MRVSKRVLAIEPGRTAFYRTMTAAVRQYDLASAEHLLWLIVSGEQYNGICFDYAPDEPSDFGSIEG